jgi:hypothetical protein
VLGRRREALATLWTSLMDPAPCPGAGSFSFDRDIVENFQIVEVRPQASIGADAVPFPDSHFSVFDSLFTFTFIFHCSFFIVQFFLFTVHTHVH